MFMMLAAFVCSMYVAIDITAGERERGSLEPLLINPVPRSLVVIGKWLATAFFGGLGMTLTLLLMGGRLAQVPVEQIGLRIALSPGLLFAMWLIMLPVTLFASSLQLLVSSFAHSFKEAQTYLSFTLFLPMLPGLCLGFRPIEEALWTLTTPLFSQQLLISHLMQGTPLDGGHVALATTCIMLLTGALLTATIAMFRREQIVFGT